MTNENQDRPMFDATCAQCGAQTKVPFEPKEDRPVYCLECFKKMRASRRGPRENSRGPRQMYPAVCAECGKKTEVPFEPKGDRPVYCQECFAKKRGQ